MSAAEFSRVYGPSERSLRRYVAERAMPGTFDKRGALSIPRKAGYAWYRGYLLERGKRSALVLSKSEARKRIDAARAQLEELKLARVQGKTTLVDEAERCLVRGFTIVRSKLLNLPTRGAAAVFGASSIADCRAKLEPLIQEMIDDLETMKGMKGDDDESQPTRHQ
jgi:hypothetical protein